MIYNDTPMSIMENKLQNLHSCYCLGIYPHVLIIYVRTLYVFSSVSYTIVYFFSPAQEILIDAITRLYYIRLECNNNNFTIYLPKRWCTYSNHNTCNDFHVTFITTLTYKDLANFEIVAILILNTVGIYISH